MTNFPPDESDVDKSADRIADKIADFLDEELPLDEFENLNEIQIPVESNVATTESSPEKPGEIATRVVADAESGWRLDLFLAAKFPQYSRVLLRKAIQAEDAVSVDGKRGKPAFRLKPGSVVSFRLVEPPRESPIPENIPLDVLYEDDDLVVINKPADMVVHPSRGHWAGTLVGALAYRFAGRLSLNRGPARPGIVHRLDRDTSGAIIVAKNDVAHANLAALFMSKHIQKEYLAIVLGAPSVDRDIVDQPIGRHPKFRERMAIVPNDPEAKTAQTYFEVVERFRGFSTIRCLPRTGRTHQIRVHLAFVGCPILCDKLYGGRAAISLDEIAGRFDRSPNGGKKSENESETPPPILARQALHAQKITFEHPTTGKTIVVEEPLPADIQATLDALRQYRSL